MLMTMKRRRARERAVPAGELKTHCLALLDDVAATGCSVVVTKRGRPVARLVSLTADAPDLRGSVVSEGDIVSPLGEPADW